MEHPMTEEKSMGTERINAIRERLNRASKGPWTACRMTHEDRGDDLTPAELGEYVQNSVVKSAGESGSNAFLFVSVEKTDGKSADVCHVGNGPTSPANADFIAHAPDDIAFLLASLAPVEPTPSAGSQTAEKDRALIAACAPYLKDGETPAQCIARNRADIDVVLTLLAQAKQTGQHLATCATNGHIYGSTDACIFCGEAKSAPVEPTSEPTPDAQVCVWRVTGDFYTSGCDVNTDVFTPFWSGWDFCPYCGKRLVVGTAPQGGEQ